MECAARNVWSTRLNLMTTVAKGTTTEYVAKARLQNAGITLLHLLALKNADTTLLDHLWKSKEEHSKRSCIKCSI